MEQQDNIPVEQKKLEGERYECVSELTRIRLDLLMKLNKIREKSKFGVKVGLSREYVSQLMNGRLRNIGSFLLKFKDIAMYENYIEEELEFEYRKKRNSYWSELTLLAIFKPLSFYDRTLIKLFKKYNFKITCDFEKLFINDYEYFKKALVTIDSLDLPIVVAKQVFCLFNSSWDSKNLKN